jgi:hypothetical protein
MVVAEGISKRTPFRLTVPSERRSRAIDFSGEGYFEFGAAWTRPAYVAAVEVTLQRSLTQFRVDGPVVFHLDPGLRGFVKLSQREIHDSFEHR